MYTKNLNVHVHAQTIVKSSQGLFNQQFHANKMFFVCLQIKNMQKIHVGFFTDNYMAYLCYVYVYICTSIMRESNKYDKNTHVHTHVLNLDCRAI